MNIGILHTTPRSSGGVYQYSENIINCLKMYDDTNNYVLFYSDKDFPYHQYEGGNWRTIFLKDFAQEKQRGLAEKCRRILKLFPFRYKSKSLMGKHHELRNYDIDLLILPSTSLSGYYCWIPYIVTIHDMMHKYYSEFPEITFLDRVQRDITYKRASLHAKFVLVDAKRGKEDLIKFYGIPEEKIRIFPTMPINIQNYNEKDETFIPKVIERHNLPDEYIFYPAQFWYHKNHVGIVKALHLLETRYNIKLPAVFVGSKKEAFDDVMRTIEELNMKNQIMYLGYVSDEEVQALYKRAIALVMPTFFGPTNIPVWEAFALGCPVITSNVHGIPEQVGDAGLLVDPRSIEDIADKIYTIYSDKDLRTKLVEKGFSRIKELSLENYAKKLVDIINEAMRS